MWVPGDVLAERAPNFLSNGRLPELSQVSHFTSATWWPFFSHFPTHISFTFSHPNFYNCLVRPFDCGLYCSGSYQRHEARSRAQDVTRSLFQLSRRERECLSFNLMFETRTRISFSQSRASRREREFLFSISGFETRTRIKIGTILARIFVNFIF